MQHCTSLGHSGHTYQVWSWFLVVGRSDGDWRCSHSSGPLAVLKINSGCLSSVVVFMQLCLCGREGCGSTMNTQTQSWWSEGNSADKAGCQSQAGAACQTCACLKRAPPPPLMWPLETTHWMCIGRGSRQPFNSVFHCNHLKKNDAFHSRLQV